MPHSGRLVVGANRIFNEVYLLLFQTMPSNNNSPCHPSTIQLIFSQNSFIKHFINYRILV
jgi:hypothetical protein